MKKESATASVLKILALVLITGALAVVFRKEIGMLLRLFLGAGFVSFVLDPLVTALSGRMPRPRAALTGMLCAAAVIAAALWLLLPTLARQFSDLVGSLPEIIGRLNGLIGEWNAFLTERGLSRISLNGLEWQKLSDSLSGLWSGTAKVFGSLAGGISNTVVSCILAYYFLSDKPAALLQAEMLVPCRWRRTLARMGSAVRDELRSYLRGQALVCLCVGAVSALLFGLIGVQGALALGLLVGIANCIPYFGPFIGGIPAVICALTGGILPAALTIGSVLLVQQIDNLLITPRITGGATGLTPPAVMISVLTGGSAFGWAGMLLAIPVVCTARCIWRVILTERCIPEPR